MPRADLMGTRKGLRNMRERADAAMATGLESSVDLPVAATLNETEQSGTLEFLDKKMRFNPRREEATVLEKLADTLGNLMAKSYQDIDSSVDGFFARIDEVGDFSKLEAIELERMILDVQKTIYRATDVVSSLYNDAYLADRIQQSEFWASYRADIEDIAKPTQGDRNAAAYSESRDSRFYYYYVYLLWRRMSDKLSALRDLQKTLEWFRSRSLKDRPF